MADTSKYTISLSAPATLTATLGAGKINVNDYTLAMEEVENGVKLTLTRGSKTETVFIPDGAKGDKGDKGDKGAQGDKGEKGDPGVKGDKGDKGDDGYSPTATVSKDGTTTTISITDKTGTTTATVEDGAKGDKGDPGSDASVTAENIQSALGYMPVAPTALDEKQDVLTDVDKQTITKTGMTSGAAWTSAEQKAARERMGVDKAYVIIKSVTTAEDVEEVVITEDDGGSAFALSRALIIVEYNGSDTRSLFSLCDYVKGNGKFNICAFDFMTYTAQNKHSVFCCFTENGYWNGLSYLPKDKYSNREIRGLSQNAFMQQSVSAVPHTNRIRVYANTGADTSQIPSGTKISVWGVRVNA